MQSDLPADAASLRETGSVDRYTPRGPVSPSVQCLVSLILSLMAPRVCTLVLSSFNGSHNIGNYPIGGVIHFLVNSSSRNAK